MSHVATRENPGAGTPGPQVQFKNSREENSNPKADMQLILCNGLWELASVVMGFSACATAVATGCTFEQIDAVQQSARLVLIKAIGKFKELQKFEVAQ
jgi:hypothetical protein